MKKFFFNSLILILIFLIIYPGNNHAQAKNESDIEMVVQKGHTGSITSISFSPDGEFIASGNKDTTIKLWNIEGILIRTFTGHSLSVNSIAFSPDGKYIASGSSDKTAKLWSINGELIRTFNIPQRGVYKVQFSPDGKYIAAKARNNPET